MRKYLIPKDGKFYKANLHVHTTVSDGVMTPHEVKKMYQDEGYSVVAFSDHEVMVPHNYLTDDSFLAMTATEISINQYWGWDFEFQKTYHFNLLSGDPEKDFYKAFNKNNIWLGNSFDYISENQEKHSFIKEYQIDNINEVIKMSNEENLLVTYNHPVWSLQDYSDYINLEGLWGVEWFNNGCVQGGFIDSIKPVDDLLRIGKNVFPVATDDAHYPVTCFGGFVMVKADSLTYDTIFNALKEGDFYSSTKPLIEELYIEDGIITIKCSQVTRIMLTTERRYTQDVIGNNITEAKFDINNYLRRSTKNECKYPYIRLTLIDKDGNEAYTRAYHLYELR